MILLIKYRSEGFDTKVELVFGFCDQGNAAGNKPTPDPSQAEE